MQVKYEWRKKENIVYLAKNKPEIIDVPEFKFIAIEGQGGPGDGQFVEKIEALYSLAYTIKMMSKKTERPIKEYVDFTVYPLEGVWGIIDEAVIRFGGAINKKHVVYKLMIRQPDFVDESLFGEMLSLVKERRKAPLLEQLKLERFAEGLCVQMLYEGPLEDEPACFEKMEAFAKRNRLARLSRVHREIYLSDGCRPSDGRPLPEKLKTLLRFQAKRV